jgi:hypothetical protein
MEIDIGGMRVIANIPNLQIPKGQTATVDVKFVGGNTKLHIEFIDGASTGVQVRGMDGAIKLTFLNFSNSLGTAMAELGTLGRMTNGDRVMFRAAAHSIGDLNVLSLLLFNGGVGQ